MSLWFELIIYILLGITCYIIGYCIFFRVNYHREIRYYIAAILLLAVFIFFLYLKSQSISELHNHLFIYGIIVPLVLTKHNKIRWLTLYPTVYIATIIIDIMLILVHSIILQVPAIDLLSSKTNLILYKTETLIILLVIHLLFRKSLSFEGPIFLRKKQILLYDIVCGVLLLMIRTLQMITADTFGSPRIKDIFIVSIVLGCTVLFFLSIYSQYLSIERERQRNQLETYNIFASEQKKQVEDMIFNDQALRNLRHDIRSHINAIKALSADAEHDELVAYCDRLIGSIATESVE